MFSKFLSFGVVGMVVFTLAVQPVLAATKSDGEIEKVKLSVRKLATGDNPTVIVKLKKGTKIEGRIGQVIEDSFELVDTKTKLPATIIFSDVSSVKKKGWSTGAKIALGIGIGAAVTVAVIAGVVGKKGLDGFCPLGCPSILRR
jgi:hypothetical protein